MNRVVLVGRLTKDPELRKTNSGSSVLRFTVAVNRRFSNQQGEREADFISCVAWNKIAENMSAYLGKGSLVGVDGRIQTGSYDDQNGNRVYTTEVVAENVDFLESRNANQQQQSYNQPSQDRPQPAVQNNNPSNDFFADFETNSSSNDILSNLDISDDELPF